MFQILLIQTVLNLLGLFGSQVFHDAGDFRFHVEKVDGRLWGRMNWGLFFACINVFECHTSFRPLHASWWRLSYPVGLHLDHLVVILWSMLIDIELAVGSWPVSTVILVLFLGGIIFYRFWNLGGQGLFEIERSSLIQLRLPGNLRWVLFEFGL